MSDGNEWRFRFALVASSISTLGWLGVVFGTAYTMFAVIAGGAAGDAAVYTVVAALIGAAFAKAETALYDTDESALRELQK